MFTTYMRYNILFYVYYLQEINRTTLCLLLSGDITYYFAVRAYDTAGRNVAGDISPVVSASMRNLDSSGTNTGTVVGMWH